MAHLRAPRSRLSPSWFTTDFQLLLRARSLVRSLFAALNTRSRPLASFISSQGAPESGWILLDYGNIIVHIMTPKSRSYYDLESFWSNGVEVPLEGVLKPNVAEQQQQEVAVVEEVVSFFFGCFVVS